MFKHLLPVLMIGLSAIATAGQPIDVEVFNRQPLMPAPYAALPAGAVKPAGWLKDQLQRMADGMTGRLDELYPEVCGPSNAWLGGPGDCWERGPYWVDGLLPLAHQLDDDALLAKAQKWIDWTLENQREDGYLGPRPYTERPEPGRLPGTQQGLPEDWWPRMVMLKVLQQHYLATGDERVMPALLKYFRYQLDRLPTDPLNRWSWWARERGGDNLMVVLWTYNQTGEPWLLELADLLIQQTRPFTAEFLGREVLSYSIDSKPKDFIDHQYHCVNLAQGMKTPIIAYQRDHDEKHLEATRLAFRDIYIHHGQPHGMYGGDEPMHGRALNRGSELCSAVEMMFSLENMLAVTGDTDFGDRIEKIAYNMLPTQISDDALTRQYFQQANQVQVTLGERNFVNDGGDRLVYGLLDGYPCCTCNLHQGWPKFVQHLWMASRDGGVAAMLYGPCRLETTLPGGAKLVIDEQTDYPFRETIRFTLTLDKPAEFPLHLRVPGWCEGATVTVNGKPFTAAANAGSTVRIPRTWASGDVVELTLPMAITRNGEWQERSESIERGPLVYALRIGEQWSGGTADNPRQPRECRPTTPWNYALFASRLDNPAAGFEVVELDGPLAENPWTLENAPIELRTAGVRVPTWGLSYNSADAPPISPVREPVRRDMVETIRLIPYGCTTLRISAFPWVDDR